jgi:hypothetical protein
MAYTIDRYNKGQLTVIEDGTIDQTTDLKLVGKNYAGYGEIQNENFVYLLENFSGTIAPPRALSGQLWFDSGNSKLKFWDGFQWRTTGGAEVTSNVPTGLKVGDFWWDSDNEQLYTYNGTDFVLIGPQSAGSGQTQIVSRTVRDTGGGSRGIITAVVNDEVTFVVSSQDFTIDTSDVASNIVGFDRIKQGITLKNTLNSSGGVTSGDWRFWGTASNTEKLGGQAASNYVRKDAPAFNSLATFADAGIQIGDSGDMRISIESTTTNAVIANEVGTQIVFKAKDLLGNIKNPIRMFADAVIPGFVAGTEFNPTPTRTATTLGSADYPWANIYADTFTGLAQRATNLVVGGTNYLGSLTATPNTVAVRNIDGDIFANVFQGVAAEARYADLAEKYTTDQEHVPGTIVTVCEHADHELEACQSNNFPVGVVSTAPAYLMNAEADGQAIALKGRVPVRVVGAVKKGDIVYAGNNGVGSLSGPYKIGVALESNSLEDEKLIECILVL